MHINLLEVIKTRYGPVKLASLDEKWVVKSTRHCFLRVLLYETTDATRTVASFSIITFLESTNDALSKWSCLWLL